MPGNDFLLVLSSTLLPFWWLSVKRRGFALCAEQSRQKIVIFFCYLFSNSLWQFLGAGAISNLFLLLPTLFPWAAVVTTKNMLQETMVATLIDFNRWEFDFSYEVHQPIQPQSDSPLLTDNHYTFPFLATAFLFKTLCSCLFLWFYMRITERGDKCFCLDHQVDET